MSLYSVNKDKRNCRRWNIFIVFLICLNLQSVVSAVRTDRFPVEDGMKLQVQFWINIFSRYSNYKQIIHDSRKPERIYRVIDLKEYSNNKETVFSERDRIIKRNKEDVKLILKKLGTGYYNLDELSKEEYRIYKLFGKKADPAVFEKAVRYVRVQGGMREKFCNGVKRSGCYIERIKKIFKEEGVPEKLIWLAHVESSFNPEAKSRYGAVGIWQFTRATGKRFLTINKSIDERKDPYLSSRAAAKLLKSNFNELGSWPLAVTAYNYGLNGIKRAVKKTGSQNIYEIITNYRSPRFGFASKNFYAEFIAAVYTVENLSGLFGNIELSPPERFGVYRICSSEYLKTISIDLGIPQNKIEKMNPALSSLIRKNKEKILKGCLLRIPLEKSSPCSFQILFRHLFLKKRQVVYLSGLDIVIEFLSLFCRIY